MSPKRIFSAEELRIGSSPSAIAMSEALERGDREAAQKFARRLRREVLSMKQNYDGWQTALRAWIGRTAGDAKEAEAGGFLDARVERPEGMPDGSPTEVADRWRAIAAAIGESIGAQKDDLARKQANALHVEALTYHDNGMARVAHLLSFIGRSFGVDLLEEAYEEAMAGDMLGTASYRERAEALMHFTRVHLQPFKLEEDDEKLTFLCSVCPSGGRLLQEGAYSERPEGPEEDAVPGDSRPEDARQHAALFVEGPRALTYQRDSLPIYCCHEPIMERASIRRTGAPLFIVDPSENLGVEPCKTYLYKDPAAIPEHFYTRLGLEKPDFD